jgi:hypothetical protein
MYTIRHNNNACLAVRKIFGIGLFILSTLLFSLSSASAQETTDTISEKLAAAEELYYEGKFNEAVSLVNECLIEKSVQAQDKKTAYKLLANIRLSQENPAAAETDIRQLLAVDPDYTPTIEQETPQFVKLVTEVKAKIKQEQPKKKTWLWIGAGAAAAVAVTTFLIIQGNDDGSEEPIINKPLALPPAWPE